MTYRTLTRTAAAAAIAIGAVAVSATSTMAASFYDGKTVTLIVNSGAGGGLTRGAQTVAKVMQKYIGENSKIIVKNIPGGGGVKGANFLAEKAKSDGLTILYGPAQQMPWLLKMPGIRFDPSEFRIIGVGDTSFLTITRTDTGAGLKTPADIVKAGGVRFGGRGPTSPLDIFGRLPLLILGVEHNYIPGYRGQPKLNQAIRSKEINTLSTGANGYHAFYKDTLIKKGEAMALFYNSPVDKNGVPIRYKDRFPANIPHFADLYQQVHGKAPSGPLWEAYKWVSSYLIRPTSIVAPKGTPDDRLALLRAGYGKTVADADFQAEWKKQFIDLPNFLVGKDAEWLLSSFKDMPEEARNSLKILTAKKKKK